MNVEAQIADLDRRVAALEKTAKAQDRHNARVAELLTELKEDVALLRRHAISTGQKVEELEVRLAAVEAGLEGVRGDLASVRGDLASVRADVAALRRDLPGIIAETMREVLREGK
jgi:uncharacterized coiled-coil protein SlyX